MKKRSAMFIAAGLVLAMIVAGVGFAMGMTGPTADAKKATLHVKAKREKPVVHTVTKTITIHKKAKATDDGPATSQPVIIQQATAPPTTSSAPTTSTSSSGESENESEHESSDSGSEDPSGTASSGEGQDD
ncbi:MAG: hypothetical protein ACXVQJ_00585 [Actinomycetota bacterium]